MAARSRSSVVLGVGGLFTPDKRGRNPLPERAQKFAGLPGFGLDRSPMAAPKERLRGKRARAKQLPRRSGYDLRHRYREEDLPATVTWR
jgi:hypothetical protein